MLAREMTHLDSPGQAREKQSADRLAIVLSGGGARGAYEAES